MKPHIEIWFELENRCNLKCKFCYNYWKDGEHKEPNSLSAIELIDCLKNLFTQIICDKITLSGGEPLLRKDLWILIEFIQSNNIPMVLTSNGLLLTNEIIDTLKLNGVVTFEVPLHSMHESKHDFLSGKPCFKESINSILMLKQKNCNVIPVFVATKYNLHDFIEVLKACSLLGINQLIFNRFIPSGLGKLNQNEIGVPTDAELTSLLEDAYLIAKKNNIAINLGVPINLSKSFLLKANVIHAASCPVMLAQTRWTIDAGGNLRRCNHSHQSIGNLLSGGEKILAEELLANQHTSCENEFHTCQFIDTTKKYEISVF